MDAERQDQHADQPREKQPDGDQKAVQQIHPTGNRRRRLRKELKPLIHLTPPSSL
jgi:hypothetical protein